LREVATKRKQTGNKAETCFHIVSCSFPLCEHFFISLLEVNSVAGKPYQSSLIPYEDEIIALRRKRPPMPYSKIAEELHEKYQVTVNREAIFKFIKLRVKGYKSCKYDAWDIEPINAPNQPTTEAPSAQKQTVSQTSKQKASSEVSSFNPSEVKITEYSPTWNLHRPNSDEEREAYRQHLREEKLKQQLLKEN
jgi:hypothetical protein